MNTLLCFGSESWPRKSSEKWWVCRFKSGLKITGHTLSEVFRVQADLNCRYLKPYVKLKLIELSSNYTENFELK